MFQNYKKVSKIVLIILTIPLFGNVFVSGWNWNFFDFVFAFIILFTFGIFIDNANRKIVNIFYRKLTIVLLVTLLFVVWVEAATGGLSDKLLN